MADSLPDPAKCPKYLPADNPARINRDLYIIDQAAKGTPQNEISRQTGLSQPAICQLLSDEQAQAKLQELIKFHIVNGHETQRHLISMAHGKRITATDPNTGQAITEDITATDQIKAIAESNKIMGISSNHASQIINNMLQINVGGGQVPQVIKEFMGDRGDVMPGEYAEIDTQEDGGQDAD